ncbi:MAG TPA: glycoside hydrolase family 2 TIM barrel-domain containing protein [Propionibacteriaceae bacterium]|nr:glycoside hydrolase family 2 TIM barrel-domain containing protein [Propionibacteriaceae bacterium]
MTSPTGAALSYFEDFSPGSGRRTAARSWVHTDAPRLSLNGDWRFRLSPTADADEAVASIEFDDSTWDLLPVPSHWVLHGDGRYGRPAYTNVQYPFPIDPPQVPDENPTGDHRRSFELPDWEVERLLLRFDGVESTYKVWLNGVEVGVGKGSRLAQEFDVTELARPGRNVLVVRVHQWSSASYLEDQDQWWLPGIFREVNLIGRPAGAIDDVWVQAGYDAESGLGSVRTELSADASAYPITVDISELGVRHTFESADDVAPFSVGAVEPWSAEAPRLYEATITSSGEQVRLRLGFRTVRIVGDIFTVNGAQLTFRGMNRHETHPVRGRMFDEDHARSDLELMKQHNVNAIRTSHYPPHPRVLDLCDELGFWVIDECDLETHGFHYVNWVGNPSDDPRWESAYLDRIERTVERDKNHPCVIIWSLGNESGTGRNLAQMSQWVHRRDASRPVHYEGDYTCSYTDVYSRMYPNLTETANIGGSTGELLECGPAEGVRVRSKPFFMCEYAHAMGNGPGALTEYDDLAERWPRLHGGFIWEWRDHGLLTAAADGTEFYGYGGDFDEVVHDGNFVMDGMVLPDDTPTPSLAEFAAVSAPIVFDLKAATSTRAAALTVRSRYTSVDTSHLRFLVTVESEGVQQGGWALEVPPVAPGTSVDVALPPETVGLRTDVETWLNVTAELAADAKWARAGHIVSRAQYPLTAHTLSSRPRLAPAPRTPAPVAEGTPAVAWTEPSVEQTLTLGPATFDARTGRLTRLYGIRVDGPWLELWRGPTDNDRSDMRGSYELGFPELTGGEGAPGPSSERRWRDRGLNRLVHRVTSVEASANEAVTRVRVSAANSGLGVDVAYRWRTVAADRSALALRVDVVPTPNWDCTWPRVGVRFDLPAGLRQARWFGTGPHESYPDTRRAARVGRFEADVDELNVRYSRPQETGHRAELRWLELAEGTTPRLRLATLPDQQGHRPGFTLTRHTPQQLDSAAHPHELPDNDVVFLFLDAAVHGVGSRACGIDVLPEHALWPGAHSFEVVFSEPA